MNTLFSSLTLADLHQDVCRNIVSLHQSQDLFDDLSSDPAAWRLAQLVEDEVKPPVYRSHTPLIHRPFEDAQWFNAIAWPFQHWQASRFSPGNFGVWYGSESIETTVYETTYHWHQGLVQDAGFERHTVVAERKVYAVALEAALLDLRSAAAAHPGLVHPQDYQYCQAVGARVHREGHPGLLVASVRRPSGENVAVFNPAVLSNPRLLCQLSYRLEGGQIVVEKQADSVWLCVDTASLS